MATPNSVPAETNSPVQPTVDINSVMAVPMPVPSEVERRGAIINAVTADPNPPLETPVIQPHIEQPVPIQPIVPQPEPAQPVAPQPVPTQPQVPVQPTPADLQQQINNLTAQAQARETVYETQRAETETQQQAAQNQQIVAAARDHATRRYQQYITAGVTAAEAQNLARDDYQTIGNAYTFQAQQQQANVQTTNIARQYGISPQDIPTGLPQQAMEQFASMRSELNRLGGQQQVVQQQVATQQVFDSGQAAAPANALEGMITNLGDPNKAANPKAIEDWYALIRQNFPNA